jgi:hypothetical protein
LRNRTPYSKIGGKTPYELWNGLKPTVSHFRVFGADIVVHIPTTERKGLDDKAKCVGYSTSQKAYRVWNIDKQRVEVAPINTKTTEMKPYFPWTNSKDIQKENSFTGYYSMNH